MDAFLALLQSVHACYIFSIIYTAMNACHIYTKTHTLPLNWELIFEPYNLYLIWIIPSHILNIHIYILIYKVTYTSSRVASTKRVIYLFKKVNKLLSNLQLFA